ncbi:pyridoxal phosphate-dependent aminotransferase [Sediminispirochaeta bajacaliforniensis]|uniref:pyridoxal phosphate-dependent aminotransferase n=1 Tax=Sediminispirochaeta bajacaliforniensis TaxID=148 RepID=UPI00037F55BA|nr:histidinol-phosphate transaminase [Sediminispirochaeta bajacaliforniensis]
MVPDAKHQAGKPEQAALIRPELLTSQRVVHGGREAKPFDFSVCLNPYPLPDSVATAIAAAPMERYPDTRGQKLTGELAMLHGCDPERLLLTNGVSQAIFLTAFGLLERGRNVLIIGPTYEEYAKNSALMGARLSIFRAQPQEGFTLSIPSLIRTIGELKPALTWICNPNNPTGLLLDKRDIEELADSCSSYGGLLVVDEAYMNFVDENRRYCAEAKNVVVLRSMTKDFALPGLRLGYIIAPHRIARALSAACPEWSINAPALAAGLAAIRLREAFETQWQRLRLQRQSLEGAAAALGYGIFPGTANFFLLYSGANARARRFREHLAASDIALRDCTSFNLPGFYRIGISSEENNRQLLGFLAAESGPTGQDETTERREKT